MDIADATVILGVLLVTAPLWVGLVSPYESVHGYQVNQPSADPDSEQYLGTHLTPLADVSCSAHGEWSCPYVEQVSAAGSVNISGFFRHRAVDYARGDQFYRWTYENTESGAVVSLEPVAPGVVLEDIARDPSPALERALESGFVPATFDVPAEHVVYETSEGYRAIGRETRNMGAETRNTYRTAAEWLGCGLGIAALVRGQHARGRRAAAD